MANDRVSELYCGRIMPLETREACRQRIDWMCSQAVGPDVLDVGCSQGIVSILLGRRGCRVVGVDVDPDAIEYAQRDLEKEEGDLARKVAFQVVTPGRLPFDDETFDSVVLGEILEHQTDPQILLAQACRVLRPGGRVVVTVPYGVHPHPEHFQTFYLTKLLELIEPEFRVCELTIIAKFICCAAERTGKTSQDVSLGLTSHRLLQMSEKAFERAEQTYWDRHQASRERIEKMTDDSSTMRSEAQILEQISHDLRKQAAAASPRLHPSRRGPEAHAHHPDLMDAIAEVDAARVELQRKSGTRETFEALSAWPEKLYRLIAVMQDAHEGDLEAERRRLTRELKAERLRLTRELEAARTDGRKLRRRLETQLSRQTERANHFQAEAERKFEEIRYRLGDVLVRAASHPKDLLAFPGRLVILLRDGIRRRRERRRKDPSASPDPGAVPPVAVEKGPSAENSDAKSQANRTPACPPQPLFEPAVAPEHPPNHPVKAAVIMDEFTAECFRSECHLLPVTPDNWERILSDERPDFLFVESAWKGNDGAWASQITRAEYIKPSPLLTMIQGFKDRGIPTVFWNKEDPPNFEHFIYAASHFDHVFTSDEHCIPRYRERVGHDRVHVLPFAVQPDIHNPIGSKEPRKGSLCFAGTYYAKRHDDRRNDIDILLKPALSRGLQIFDRMHGYDQSDYYRFPPEYAGSIQGALSYLEMVTAYKCYHVFLNVNSVKDSPTMFSRRVLELLACGTPVVSTPSVGIEQMLGRECVALVNDENEAAQWMDRLLDDPELGERMTLLGQRKIFAEHTYNHRLGKILAKLGLHDEPTPPGVSVITCTNRPRQLEHLIANYDRQIWPEKELVLVLNSDAFDLAAVEERLRAVPGARVFQLPESASLGECLNYAIDQCRFDFLTKFDDDNYHAEHFLGDLMHAFTYSGAHVVGKLTYYAYLEGQRCLALRFPDQEHRFVRFLSGSAMIFTRRVADAVRFPEKSVGEDTGFLQGCLSKGFKMYSADRFNYVVRRAASPDEHTWKVDDREYLKKCRIVAHTDDYRAHVCV